MIRFCIGFLLCLCLLAPRCHAQQIEDSTLHRTFTVSDLEDFLMTNHPVVKQTLLLSETAKAQVLQALGKFDPALYTSFNNKHFGNTAYYNQWSSELKVPLWLAGADLKVGYDRNVGAYTNPQSRTNRAGLSALGISVPLGQGLFIDGRRNTLWQAEAMLGYAEAQQVKEINGIWFQAVSDYWNWYYAYKQYILLVEGVKLAEIRFRAISEQTLLGDKPTIDSVEAAITVQERKMELAKYEIELKNARLVLSNHLWNAQQQPLELPEDAVPDSIDRNTLTPSGNLLAELLEQAETNHPEILQLGSKELQLSIEERYRRELLKPKLNLSGTLLSSRRNFNEQLPPDYDFNWGNYKLGVEFAFPLFLRNERGKLKEVRLKQQELIYDQTILGRNIRNDVTLKYNDLTAYSKQITLQIENIINQETLLRGELQKFDLGETTLFIINSRESKLIDMQIKREGLIVDYQKALAELYYKAGTRL